MNDEMLYALEGMAVGLGQAAVGLLAVSCLVILLKLLLYVLESLGLYSLSSRRGIRHAWLSWIPFGSIWILGSLSDQYQYVVRARNRKKRKVLLTLNLLTSLSSAVAAALILTASFCVIGAAFNPGAEDAIIKNLAGLFLVLMLLCFSTAVGIIVQSVITYIALYDVYLSANPKNGAAFLVLSIFFGITVPFFLFGIRKSDRGMEPRPAQSPWGSGPCQTYCPSEGPGSQYQTEAGEPVDLWKFPQ